MGISGSVVSGLIKGIETSLAHLPPSEAIIFDIAVVLIVAAILALLARLLRQPLIPAYVISGLVIGPLVLGLIKDATLINAFSEIGIAFLLFIAGLEISFKKIKEANLKKILLIGTLQIILVFVLGFFIADIAGLNSLQAAYIGIILAFSSTMVDVKLLADKGELVTLHGRLVLGILLLQDLAAVIAIVLFTTGSFNIAAISAALVKLAMVIVFAILLQRYVLNKMFKFAARSSELLFLTSLAVLFLFIIASYLSKLSIVIGAFIAGVSLANSPFKPELESRISPLRDFFAILFFVALGMQIVFSGVDEYLRLLFFLIASAVFLKPIIIFVLMRILGYQPRTSFQTSSTLAQLSEFSLIIGILGASLGVINPPLFSTIILATIITMSITPYLVEYKESLYKAFKYPIGWFNHLPVKENHGINKGHKKDIILIGAHRMGSFIIEKLRSEKEKLLVIDYNPEIINLLRKSDIDSIYGDINSPELIQNIDLKGVKTVISTVPSFKENLRLLRIIKSRNKRIKVVLTGNRISETMKLYDEGADYVITPKVLAGEEISTILRSKRKDMKDYKKEHIRILNRVHRLFY